MKEEEEDSLFHILSHILTSFGTKQRKVLYICTISSTFLFSPDIFHSIQQNISQQYLTIRLICIIVLILLNSFLYFVIMMI